jgi:hypothetical protein
MISYLDVAIGVHRNPGTQVFGKHLCTETNAEQRFALAQSDFDPLDLGSRAVVGIVGAPWPTEDDGPCVPGERRGQLIAATGAAHVERMAEAIKLLAHVTGYRGRLMQHSQHRQSSACKRRRDLLIFAVSVEHYCSLAAAAANP